MSASDRLLIERFVRQHDEDAFGELVRRHIDLVHSAALRLTRSPQLAGDVVQCVFTDLARNAGRLRKDTVLPAWLYQVARRTAIDLLRSEIRRRLREQTAAELHAMNATANDWAHIEPLLDDAMAALDETDRAAVLLRFFENKSLREVGQTLGTSDDAAQKRVSRALDRLRDYLGKHGVATGAASLAAAISGNAVQAAPAGLAAATGTTALSAAAATGTAKALAWPALQKALVAGAVVVGIGANLHWQGRTAGLETVLAARRNELAITSSGNARLSRELAALRDSVAASRSEVGALRQQVAEVPKLRGTVAALQANAAAAQTTPDAMELAARKWTGNVQLLKAKFDEIPGQRIPELEFLADYNWHSFAQPTAALGALEEYTVEQWKSLLGKMRETAKQTVAHRLGNALDRFIADHNGLLPGHLSELNAYHQPSWGQPATFSDELLGRYQLVATGSLQEHDETTTLIREILNRIQFPYDSEFSLTVSKFYFSTPDGGLRGEGGPFNASQAARKFLRPKP